MTEKIINNVDGMVRIMVRTMVKGGYRPTSPGPSSASYTEVDGMVRCPRKVQNLLAANRCVAMQDPAFCSSCPALVKNNKHPYTDRCKSSSHIEGDGKCKTCFVLKEKMKRIAERQEAMEAWNNKGVFHE